MPAPFACIKRAGTFHQQSTAGHIHSFYDAISLTRYHTITNAATIMSAQIYADASRRYITPMGIGTKFPDQTKDAAAKSGVRILTLEHNTA